MGRVRLAAGLIALGLSLALFAFDAAAAPVRLYHFAIQRASLSAALRIYAEICDENVIFTEAAVADAPPRSLVGDFTATEALRRLLAGTRLEAARSISGALMILRPAGTASADGATTAATPSAPATQPTPATVPTAKAGPPAPPTPTPATLSSIVVTGTRIASDHPVSDSPLVSVGRGQLAAAGQVSLEAAIGQMPQFSAAQGQTEVGDVQGATGFQGGQSYADLRGLGANRTLVLQDGRRLVPTAPNGAVDLNLIPSGLIESVDVITGGASAVYGSDAIAGVINFRLRHDFSGIELDLQHGATTHGDGAETQLDLLLGGHFGGDRGRAVLDLEYADRAAVTGADRASFFGEIPRKVPRPPEGLIDGIDLGGLPTIAAVNAVLAQYPNTSPLIGSGPYTGAIGVNHDGTIFTANAAPNCVQNYRGPLAPATRGLALSPDCTQINAYLGPYFAIQVPMRRYNLFTRMDYAFSDRVRAYAQFGFMHSTSQDLQAPAFTGAGKYLDIPLDNPYVAGNAALQSILASRSNPQDPAALTQPLQMSAWLTEFGPRIETFHYDDYQAVGGLRGALSGGRLAWDVYASYGENRLDNTQQNNVNLPALETILYGTAHYLGSNGQSCAGYAWNPLGGQALSPGCLQYVVGTAHNTNLLTQQVVEGTLSGELARLPEGKLRFALGADYRGDRFRYSPDALLDPTFNAMPAGLPVNVISPSYDLVSPTSGSQAVREAYAELSIPLLAHARYAEDAAIDLGARHSEYDVFGAADTWKADFHWRIDPKIMLRGGVERALRAPSLGELYDTTRRAQDNVSVDPCEVGSSYRNGANAAAVRALCLATGVPAALYPSFTYGLQSIPGISSGNPALRPETARTYSLGLVLTPRFSTPWLRELRATIDYYRIHIDGVIALMTLDQMLARCFDASGANPGYSAANYYCRQFVRDAQNGDITSGTEVWRNLAAYSTDGVDLEWHWGAPLEALGFKGNRGHLEIDSYLTFLRSLAIAELPGAPSFDYAGTLVATSASPDLAHPRWKANTAIGYSVGRLRAALRWRLVGAMADWVPSEGPTAAGPHVPPYHYFDLDGHWQLAARVELRAGVTNLFDKAPPVVVGAPLYTDAATYDAVGRTWYLGFTARIP
ncbi:MAG: TonB-dependent receptor [Gammaproteobacteria bacterium]|nr:TonB-dependent receptor [Gammaproteobacteria bacterium]